MAGLVELPDNSLHEIDKSVRRLVKIFGAQKNTARLILSSEINLPKSKIKQ